MRLCESCANPTTTEAGARRAMGYIVRGEDGFSIRRTRDGVRERSAVHDDPRCLADVLAAGWQVDDPDYTPPEPGAEPPDAPAEDVRPLAGARIV